jgi:hypothetical protein
VCAAALLLACAGPWAGAQPSATRKSATLEALVTYPAFFHMQPVRVRGEVRERESLVVLADEGREILLVADRASGRGARAGDRVEVTGQFVDPGRLEPGDPRLRGVDVGRLSESRLGKPWPGVAELLLLQAEAIDEALPYTSGSIRALALDPERFLDQSVRLVGRFRGRNLFGDQPNAPGRSRWDFVVASADASVWVTGLRPRGNGFTLDIEARADGSRWIEVTGTVRRGRGLVYVEGATIQLARPPAESPAEPVVRVPTAGPPPEIVFSTPIDGEVDVSPTTSVRVQFSRDLARESLSGRILVGYQASEAEVRGEPPPPPIGFTTTYTEANRSLEIRFREPLARFRTVVVEFKEGIEGTDGASMAPASIRFAVGG